METVAGTNFDVSFLITVKVDSCVTVSTCDPNFVTHSSNKVVELIRSRIVKVLGELLVEW